MKRSVLSCILFTSLLCASAFAEDFSVDSLAKICGQKYLRLSTCSAIKTSRPENLHRADQRKLKSLIENSTDSWADSIFEGDVDSNQEDLEYTVRSLTEKATGRHLGRVVRFSYLGWETSCAKDDSYDRKKPDTYKDCKKGRIYQTIVVSPDLKDFETLSDAELILPRERR